MKTLWLAFLLMVGGVLLYFHGARSCRLEPRRPAPVAYAVTEYPPPTITVRPEREAAEGLPVPIYPGTRVAEAEIAPPRVVEVRPGPDARFSTRLVSSANDQPPGAGIRRVVGQLRGTEQRALADARTQLDREVALALAPEVPASWKAPANLVDRLIVKTRTRTVVKEYGNLYESHIDADFTSTDFANIRAAYRRDLVAHRIVTMAGGLGFVLACLASLAGYIRADEATKGYYTNWLRAAAAAGAGASGVVLYQLLA